MKPRTNLPTIFAYFAAFLLAVACVLAFARVAPEDAPRMSKADDTAAFCREFMDNLAYRVVVSASQGTPREAWRVTNGPDYMNKAITAFVYAVYSGKYPAAGVLYDAAVAACVRYRTELDA
jgi:hypothetical protein